MDIAKIIDTHSNIFQKYISSPLALLVKENAKYPRIFNATTIFR